eukprot:scaffold1118_cov152-Ochromonas_danica.AAC.1
MSISTPSSLSSWYEWLHTWLQNFYLIVRLEEWQEDLRQWQEGEWLRCVPAVDGKSGSEEMVRSGSRLWRFFYSQLREPSGVERGSGRDYTVEKKRSMLLNILQAGRLLHEVRLCVFWLVVMMVCVGGSVYGSLTVFYGSYDHEYAWTLSAAYLSGVGASSALVAYFVCLLCVSGWMCLRGVGRWLLFPSGWSGEVSGGGKECESAMGRAGGCEVVVEEDVVGVKVCLSREEEKHEVCSAQSVSVSTPVDAGGRDKGQIDDAMEGGGDLDVKVAAEKNRKQKRSNLDWCAVLSMKVCIAVPLQHHEGEGEGEERIGEEGGRGGDVAVGESGIGSGGNNVWIGREESLLSSRTRGGLRREGLHEENVRFMSSLMLFNTIVAPCLATMVASSDCFYYVFASPETITASYSFDKCSRFTEISCEGLSLATLSTVFSPPFSYTYQCSSAMLVDYAYVFAYKYVLIGILYPLFVLGVVLYVDWHRSKEKANEKEKMGKGEVEMVKSGREKKEEQIGAGVHGHPGYD